MRQQAKPPPNPARSGWGYKKPDTKLPKAGLGHPQSWQGRETVLILHFLCPWKVSFIKTNCRRRRGRERRRWLDDITNSIDVESEQTLGNSEQQGSLRCTAHGVTESDMTKQLDTNKTAQDMMGKGHIHSPTTSRGFASSETWPPGGWSQVSVHYAVHPSIADALHLGRFLFHSVL